MDWHTEVFDSDWLEEPEDEMFVVVGSFVYTEDEQDYNDRADEMARTNESD